MDHPWLHGETRKRQRVLKILKLKPGIGLLYVAVWSSNLEFLYNHVSVMLCYLGSAGLIRRGDCFAIVLLLFSICYFAFQLEDCEFRDAT